MANLPQRLCVAGVLIALLFALLSAHAARQAPPPRRRGRKRRRPPAAAPAAAGGGLLSLVRWDTVMNMLHWKAEMSRLDDIIESIQ